MLVNRNTCATFVVASVIVIAVLITALGRTSSERAKGSQEHRRTQASLGFSGPVELAAAANRGVELSPSLGLQQRYMRFDWVVDGKPSRGACIYASGGEGSQPSTNCYRYAQIRRCNAFQSSARSDSLFESVGLAPSTSPSVLLRIGGRYLPAPTRDGAFTVVSATRVTSCKIEP